MRKLPLPRLLVSLLLFIASAWGSVVFAYTPVVGGKVKYVFETKNLTKTEAEAIVNAPNPADRYVDLWVYAYFSKEGFSNYFSSTTEGPVTGYLTFQSNTHSYIIINEQGTVDQSGIARFAVSNPTYCSSDRLRQPAEESGAAGAPYRKAMIPTFIDRVCPNWGYAASTGNGSFDGSGTCVLEGDWYKVKLYTVRFEYKKAEPFYASFYGGKQGQIDEAIDALTFNIADGAEPLVWDGWTNADNNDWVGGAGLNKDPSQNPNPDIMELVPGGVKIVSGLEASLTLNKACPGSDISGNLSISFPEEKNWSDYTTTFQLKNQTQTVALAVDDLTFTPDLSGTATAHTLSLKAAALNKLEDADSLIMIISSMDDPSETYRVSAFLEVVQGVDIHFAASLKANEAFTAPVIEKVKGSPSVITVDEYQNIVGKWICTDFLVGSPVFQDYQCGFGDNNQLILKSPTLYRSNNQNGAYNVVKGPSTNMALLCTEEYSVGSTSAYYFLEVYKDGCPIHTDTVLIQIQKPLNTPVLSLNTFCGTGFEVSGTIDADQQPTAWEWLVRDAPLTIDPSAKDGFGFLLKDGEEIAVPGWEAPNGPDAKFKVDNIQAYTNRLYLDYNKSMLPTVSPCNILMPTSGENVWGSDTDRKLVGKYIFSRCKIGDAWTLWSFVQMPNSSCENGINTPPEYKGDFSQLAIGISATPCVGSDVPPVGVGCNQTDTTVDKGSPVKLRLWVNGKVQSDKSSVSIADNMSFSANGMMVYWQYADVNGHWVTWARSGTVADDVTTKIQNGLRYVESPVRYISETENHRAVFLYNGCAVATTDEDDAEGGFNGDGGNDAVALSATAEWGHYDDVVTINVKSDIIAGTIQGRSDNGQYDTDPIKMCYGSTLDMKVIQSGSNPANMVWQVSADKVRWDNVVSGPTGAEYINADIPDGNDLYAGRKVYYRVKVTEGMDEAFTNVFEVTIYKAKKIYIAYMPENGEETSKKDTIAGFCHGSSVYLFGSSEKNGENDKWLGATGEGYQAFGFQSVSNASLQYNFGEPPAGMESGIGNPIFLEKALANTWNIYRVVSYNQGCYAIGDTLILKQNPKVTTGTIQVPADICQGTEASLTVAGGNADIYQWKIPTSESGNFVPDLIVDNNQSNTLTVRFPISGAAGSGDTKQDGIQVTGIGIFGVGTDTSMCNGAAAGVLVVSENCTLPAPNPVLSAICLGESELKLSWAEIFDATTCTLQWANSNTESGSWTTMTNHTDFSFTTSNNTSELTVLKTFFQTTGAGTYYFRITKNGVTSEVSAAVTVNPIPVIVVSDFDIQANGTSVKNQSVCAGTEVVFSAADETGLTYQWYKGNSTSGSLLSSSNPYTVSVNETAHDGDYLLHLTKTVDGCTATKDLSGTLTVNPLPETPTIENFTGLTLCEGAELKLEPTVNGLDATNTTTKTWYHNDSQFSPNPDADSHTVSQVTQNDAGTYRLDVKTQTTAGCESSTTASIQITVTPIPELGSLDMAVSPASPVCAGKDVRITVSVSPETGGTLQYQWTKTPNPLTDWTGINTGTITKTVTTDDSGEYTVSVTRTEGECSITKEANITLTVNPLPQAPLISDFNDITVCENAELRLAPTITYDQTSGYQTTIQWFHGTDEISSDPQLSNNIYTIPNVRLEDGGTYKVVVTTTTDPNDPTNACVLFDEKTVTVTVTPAPEITDPQISVTPGNKVCDGTEVRLTASPSGSDYTYVWLKDGGSLSQDWAVSTNTISKTVETTDAGTYKVTITRNENGCTNQAEASIVFTVNPLPQDLIVTQPTEPLTLCVNGTGELNASVTGNTETGVTYTYRWYKDDNNTPVKTATDATEGIKLTFGSAGSGADISTASTDVSGQYYLLVESRFTATDCNKISDKPGEGIRVTVETCGNDVLAPLAYEVCPDETTPKTFTLTYGQPLPSSVVWQQSTDRTTWISAAGSSTCESQINSTVCQFTPTSIPSAGTTVYYRAEVIRNGNTFYSDEAAYTVYSEVIRPVVTIKVTPEQAAFCAGTTAGLAAEFTPEDGYSYTYAWNGPNSFTSTDAEVSLSDLTTAQSGEYTLVVTATNTVNACSNTADVARTTLTVNPAATRPTITLENATVCAGQSHTFDPEIDPSTAQPNGNYTYKWTLKADPGTILSTDKNYEVRPAIATETYVFTVTATTDQSCAAEVSKEVSLTVNPTPDITDARLIADPSEICSGTPLKLTASAASTGGNPSYVWYHAAPGGDTLSEKLSETTASYEVASAQLTDRGDYTVRIIYTQGECSAMALATTAVTVTQTPAIASVSIDPSVDPIKCAGEDITFTATVDPATATAGTYTYQWYKDGTAIKTSDTDLTLSLTNLSTADAGEYKFEVTATNGSCSDTKDASVQLTVTQPADLGNIAVSGAETEKCLGQGAVSLQVTGVPAGVTATYQWLKDNVEISSATSATYAVPAVLGSNAQYSCEVTVAATSENPCTAVGTTAAVEVSFKLCGTEVLSPGTDASQNGQMALLCQRGDENSMAKVSYEPQAEKDAVTKVSWYKYTTDPTGTEQDGTLISTHSSPFTWPLALTQKEVFGDESAPKNYYVRAKVERGNVVTYTAAYRFAKVENAPAATGLTMNPPTQTVCLGTPASFELQAEKPTFPSDRYLGWGLGTGSSDLAYIWKDPSGTETTAASNTISAETGTAVTDAEYSARVISGFVYTIGNLTKTCRDTTLPVTGKLTVDAQPAIASVSIDPAADPIKCAGEDITFTATVDPQTATAGTYTYQWYKDGTAITTAGTDLTLSLTNLSTADAGEYKFEVSATNGSCSDTKDASVQLAVTRPADLSNIAVSGAETEKCLDQGAVSLQVTGVPAGVTAMYQWLKDNVEISSATSATYTIPAVLSSNAQYSCKVTVAATAENPCTAVGTTAAVEVSFTLCDVEAVSPGNDEDQDSQIALLCQRGDENSLVKVTYEPQVEQAAVSKVSWYKYTTDPTGTEDDGTLISTHSSPFSWPLELTQKEVFGNEAAPKNYYVRAKVERGSVVSYTTSYRFAKVENAPVVSDPTMNPEEQTVCLGTPASFELQAEKPTFPSDRYLDWGFTSIESSELEYIWKDPSGTEKTAASNTIAAETGTAVTAAEYSSRVISSFVYRINGLTKECRDTTEPVTGKLTVETPPVIISLTDDDSQNAKTICADAEANEYPRLTVAIATGSVAKWEKSLTGQDADWTEIASAGTSTNYRITAADIQLPTSGGTAITNYYRVTVSNGSACDPVSTSYTLTVNPLPDLSKVALSGDAEYCTSGTLTATAKNAAEEPIPAGLTYQWEISSDGQNQWVIIADANASTLTVTTPGTNFYRCSVTMGTDCKVTKVSDAKQMTVSAATVPGTLTADRNAVCEDADASTGPKFTLNGHTGTILNWEVSHDAAFPAGASTVTITSSQNPFTLNIASAEITGLLSSSSRKTDLYVRPVVQSGSVCTPESPTAVKIEVYKAAPKLNLALAVSDPVCDLNATEEVTFTPALESFETVKWEYAGGSAQVDLDQVAQSERGTATTRTGLNLPATLEPRYKNDTTYTIRAVVTNTVLTSGCGPTVSDPITLKVNRKAKTPTVTPDNQTVCIGDTYTITAGRPGESALVWQKQINGGSFENLPAGETPTTTDRTETLTVGATTAGIYTYQVSDRTDCGTENATVTITVNEAPVAGTIAAAENGDFCAGTTVTVDAAGFTPAGTTLNWQVCTDKDNYPGTRIAELEKSSLSPYTATTGFTSGQTYYIRYEVPGTAPCAAAYSAWAAVRVFTAPELDDFISDAVGNICAGTDVQLSFKAKEGMTYEIYEQTTNTTSGGTLLTSGSVPAGGSVSYTVTPQESRYYYVVVSDPDFDGTGACGSTVSPAAIKITVDSKPVAGTLLFTNTGNPQASPDGKTLEAEVGQTAELSLAGAEGSVKKLYSVSRKKDAAIDWTAAQEFVGFTGTQNVPLATAHQDTTYFWVEVRNGNCPPVYSDTIRAIVKMSTKPTLELSPDRICEGSSVAMQLVIPDAVTAEFDWAELKWERRLSGTGTWTDITAEVDVNSAAKTAQDQTSDMLSAGKYDYRYQYTIGSNAPAYSNERTVTIDAASVAGTLVVDHTPVCVGSTSPVLSLSGHTGTISKLRFGTAENNLDQTLTAGAADKVYEVPTSNTNATGWYQVEVTNGVCPVALSDKVRVEVIDQPSAGQLSVAPVTVCFDNGLSTVTIENHKGTSILWKTSSARDGVYVDVPNTDQTTYQAGPLTDRIWVKAEVNTHESCTAQETVPVAVNVYDTLKVSLQPTDQIAIGTGATVRFEAEGTTAGLQYSDGDPFQTVTVKTYQWQQQNPGGSWADLTVSGDFSGVNTSILQVANAENYAEKYFRCLMTSDPCDRPVFSQPATITSEKALAPGSVESETQGDCYYRGDEAVYFVKDAEGEGTLTYAWYVRIGGAWQPLADVMGSETYTITEDGKKIVFRKIEELRAQNVEAIRACVTDKNTTDCEEGKSFSQETEVCMREKPGYALGSEIRCENEVADVRLNLTRTSAETDIVNTYEYRYRLPGQSQFENWDGQSKMLNVGTGAETVTVEADPATGDITVKQPLVASADGLTFSVKVYSNFSTDYDTVVEGTLRVDVPVKITQGAADQIVCAGHDFELKTGIEAGNTTIPGNKITATWTLTGEGQARQEQDLAITAQEASYTQTNAQATDAGIWLVEFSTEYCPAVQDQAEITVKEIPQFENTVADADGCEGETLTLSATIKADAPSDYTLQWQKQTASAWVDVTDEITADGATISGATTATLQIADITGNQAGKYRLKMTVVLADCPGEEFSDTATVTVKVKPEAWLDPQGNVTMTENTTRTVEVKLKTPAQMGYDENFVSIASVSSYEWYVCAAQQGETQFTKLNGTNYTGLVSGSVDAGQLSFTGLKAYDSTLFYARLLTDCNGDLTTDADTLRITDKFGIATTDIAGSDLCSNDETAVYTITATTTLAATECVWKVSEDQGANWVAVQAGAVPGQAGAVYRTEMKQPEMTEFKLTVTHPTIAMNGWLFRVVLTDGTDSDSATAPLTVTAPAEFLCGDVLEKTEAVIVNNGGSPSQSVFTAKSACLPGTAPDYTFAYWQKKFDAADYQSVANTTAYTFTANDTGMYYIRFIAENRCGSDTVTDSVRVIEKPEPDAITAIDKNPEKPGEPATVTGPQKTDMEIEVCEDHHLELAATYTGGPARNSYWQVKAAGTQDFVSVVMSAPYSQRADTLVIDPVSPSTDGSVYRCVFEMPGNVSPIYSQEITVRVNRKPELNGGLHIKDATDPTLADGQGRQGDAIVLYMDPVPDATQYCFYQVRSGIDTLTLACQALPEYTLTAQATVADHDSTLYYAEAYNDCGSAATPLALLRIFDVLSVQWLPDTVYFAGSDWTADSIRNPVSGSLVVAVSPLDTKQVAAYMFACEGERIRLVDTTITGFMNREGSGTSSSRWEYRESETDKWKLITPGDPIWTEAGLVQTIGKHRSILQFLPSHANPDMNGWQFRAVAVNELYSDSTVALTLCLMPVLEAGDLTMTPPVYDFCAEGEATFTLEETAGKDLSGFRIRWEVLVPGSSVWTVVDSMADRTVFEIGTVRPADSGLQLRASASGSCGADTVYGQIAVRRPLVPSVLLAGDTSACFGSDMVWTARETNGGTSPEFVWFLDGVQWEDASGRECSFVGLSAGEHRIEVRMKADTTGGACIDPLEASADTTVRIYPLPTIAARIADTVIKTGESTEVWVDSDTEPVSVWWTPADLLRNPDNRRTSTVDMSVPGYYTFEVTVTDVQGCTAVDSVSLKVLSDFRLDSIPVTVLVPPALPNEDGSVPGFPGAPYDPSSGKPATIVTFYQDTAEIWVCSGNEILLAIATSGGEPLLSYTWHIDDGSAELFYPDGCQEDVPFASKDSVFGFFFPDNRTTRIRCRITDALGAEVTLTVRIRYYVPETVYIEVTPKTLSAKYYAGQAVYFHAKPQRYATYDWMSVTNGRVETFRSSSDPLYAASFRLPDDLRNEIWLSTVDPNGCRIWDSTHVELMELPNVMILDDPRYPDAGILFPDFEVEITNMWGLRVKTFGQRNGNGQTKGWDGRTASGVKVTAGTYYYRVKIPTLDGFTYVTGAVTIINNK